MRKNTTITAKMLVQKGACEQQVQLFRRLFGKSARVTVKGCVKVASKFSWNWAARLLPSTEQKAYWKAVVAADKTFRTWQDFDKEKAAAFARCVRKWGIAE